MTTLNRFLAVCAILAISIAGTRVYDAYANSAGPRYTPREQIKLRAHSCKEDEYLFVPSKRVNDRVTYDTPDRAFCVAIELVRRAPRN